ncbi:MULTISPECIES: ATP-binding protein [unclassified Streptomyces]|uniref:ATP-binding protein n=1 Tax=unclassified Streptomyces TaxID=2593676 RepID=UPI0027E4F245|nr:MULTISPECIES: ATP-binding protein [unclassified Streptomyces]
MTTEISDIAPEAESYEFRQRLSATPRGARLARRLAGVQLAAWGIPYGCALAEDAELVVGELAANAVLHGLVPGRDFELGLRYDGRRVLVEVSDARGEKTPPEGLAPAGRWSAEGGRGLQLVEAVAREWGVRPRPPGHPGKTVWACL